MTTRGIYDTMHRRRAQLSNSAAMAIQGTVPDLTFITPSNSLPLHQGKFSYSSTLSCPQVRQRTPSTPLRMKLLSHEVIEDIFGTNEQKISKYRLTLEVPGEVSKSVRRANIANAKKQARFPGFRIGQIPPFMMREIERLILVESISKTLKEAVEHLGLKTLDGDAAEPEFENKVEDMLKSFRAGKPYTLNCTVSLQKGGVEQDQKSGVEPEIATASKASTE